MAQTHNIICANCGLKFSCGCQKTTAVDGKTVHKTCKPDYDLKVIKKK